MSENKIRAKGFVTAASPHEESQGKSSYEFPPHFCAFDFNLVDIWSEVCRFGACVLGDLLSLQLRTVALVGPTIGQFDGTTTWKAWNLIYKTTTSSEWRRSSGGGLVERCST